MVGNVYDCRLSTLLDVIIGVVLDRNIQETLLPVASSTHSLVAFRTSSYMSHSDCLALLRVVTCCVYVVTMFTADVFPSFFIGHSFA